MTGLGRNLCDSWIDAMHLTTAWTGRRPELWPPFLSSPADCLLLLKVPFYSGLGQWDCLLGHPQSPRAPYGDALRPVAASQGGRKPGRGELQSPEQPGFSWEALEEPAIAIAGTRVESWPCFFPSDVMEVTTHSYL